MSTTKYISSCFLLFYSVCAFSQTLIGQDTSNKVITTAAAFLNVTPDSRAAGMGDAGVATSPDVNSAYWNAGKLSFIEEKNGIALSYTPWLPKILNDMFIIYLSGFYKINDKQIVSMSMKYFNIGKVSFNKGPFINDQLGEFNSREFAFDLTYSRKLSKHLGIGGSLRYIHANLIGNIALGTGSDARPGNSVAADLGLFFSKPFNSRYRKSTLSLGFAITNIGAKMSYFSPENADFIPTNMRIGGTYKTSLGISHSITFALDFNKLLVPSPGIGNKDKNLLQGIFESFSDAQGGFAEEIEEITMSTGVEYWYKNTFSGRIGYFLEANDKGGRKYLTFGVGAQITRFGLDIAYMSPTNGRESPLAETIRFSFMTRFGKTSKANRK